MKSFNSIEEFLWIDPAEVNNKAVFLVFKKIIQETLFTWEYDEIKRVFDIAEKVIALTDQDLGTTWELRKDYIKETWLLRFGMINSQTEKDITFLLKEYLSSLLYLDFDLKEKLIDDIFIWGDYDNQKRKLLLELVRNNQGLVGSRKISDWLTDFDAHLLNDKGDSLDIISYFNSSSLRGIKEEDKKALINLFNAYSWLRSGGPLPIELLEPERKIFISDRTIKPSPVSNKVVVSPVPPNQQVFKKVTPAFLFDEEDEQEADKYRIAGQESQIVEKNILEERLREYAKEVVAKNNLSFKDETSQKRFELLFVSRLKEVRSVVEVKESLIKETAKGGLGMEPVKADRVVNIIEQAKKDYELRITNKVVDDSTAIHQTVSSKSDQTSGKKEIDKLIAADLPAVLPKEVLDLPPRPAQPPQPPLKPASPVKTQQPVTSSQPPISRDQVLQELAKAAAVTTQAAVGLAYDKNKTINKVSPISSIKVKPRLVDVKAPPKVVGPLDELRTLTITDFRRLSPNPAEALRKILSKIQLLGEKSVAKRIEAVRAWQGSDIYQSYLNLGRTSIEQGKSIAAVLQEESQHNQDTLTEQEFQAIVDFNEKLRF